MRIVTCHEFYYLRGGAERYLFDVSELLTAHGHQVIPFATRAPQNRPTPYEPYFVSQLDFPALLRTGGVRSALRAAPRALYSLEARRNLARLLADVQPDLVHVFGYANYLSHSILDAAQAARVPVVQSLLDYKWLCPNTTFLAHGEVCERCRDGRFYHAAVQRCKRGSAAASMVAAMQAYLAALSGAAGKVAHFLCHSRFLRDKMQAYGFPPARLHYTPHFLDAARYPQAGTADPLIVYFGRLSYEKGLMTLLRAAEIGDIPLLIIGAGEQEAVLRQHAAERGLAQVRFAGPAWGAELHAAIGAARAVVCPSEWYENSPLVIYEAMALGKPVVGAAIGGIPELVQDGVTGLLFHPGDPQELAARLRRLLDRPDLAHAWGAAARQVAVERFDSERGYRELLAVYRAALG